MGRDLGLDGVMDHFTLNSDEAGAQPPAGFAPEVRQVLLAALLFQRQREITDTLVELLNSTVHRINVRAEKKVFEAFVAEFTKVRGKSGLGTLQSSVATAAVEEDRTQIRWRSSAAPGGRPPLDARLVSLVRVPVAFLGRLGGRPPRCPRPASRIDT
ncbi:hypothetical protein [Streptomyces sp. NPDC058373]|uniref:hypothetical protein n=1 Tax=Streptomyces sp. NPDC058373 TaxID=3346465 RepID=UPI00365CDCDA